MKSASGRSCTAIDSHCAKLSSIGNPSWPSFSRLMVEGAQMTHDRFCFLTKPECSCKTPFLPCPTDCMRPCGLHESQELMTDLGPLAGSRYDPQVFGRRHSMRLITVDHTPPRTPHLPPRTNELRMIPCSIPAAIRSIRWGD